MNAKYARLASIVTVTLAMAWTSSSRGQSLNIEVPVLPEPGKSLGEGPDSGKRNPLQRPHQNEKPAAAAKARVRGNQQAAAATPAPRTTANRPADAEAAPQNRGGLFGHGQLFAGRRAGRDESTPLLARRHRTESHDRNPKQPPPSPRESITR
jgi:hypothetical protein